MVVLRRRAEACAWLTLALLVALAPSAAEAQARAQASAQAQAEADPHQEAQRLLREGLRLRRSGDEEQALARFQRAYELEPSAVAATQLGLAEQALGHWVDAMSHIQEALRDTQDEWIVQNRSILEESQADIASHLGRLRLTGGAEGAIVRVNGVERGRLPLTEPLYVEAGSVVIEVEAEGYFPFRRTDEIDAGESASHPVRLVARGEGQEEPGGQASREPDLTGAIIAFAIGGAGLIAWGTFGGLALAEDARLSGGCSPDCAPSEVEAGQTFALVADISMALGIAGVGVGAVLLALELTSSGGSGGEDPGEAQARLHLAPWISPESMGLTLGGTL